MTRADFTLLAALLALLAGWAWARPTLDWRLRDQAERTVVLETFLPANLRPRTDAIPVTSRRLGAACAALAAFFLIRDLPAPVWLAVGVLASPVAYVALGRIQSGRAKATAARLVDDLPAALDLIAACLAAGQPLRRAVAVVGDAVGGPVAAELAKLTSLVAVGASDKEAWDTLREHPTLGPLARDLSRAAESGTAMQSALSSRSEEAREQRRQSAEVRARSVGVSSVVPLGLCFLPAFMLVGVVPIVASGVLPFLP